jgi:cytochrome c oxidase subunit IV
VVGGSWEDDSWSNGRSVELCHDMHGGHGTFQYKNRRTIYRHIWGVLVVYSLCNKVVNFLRL